MSKFLNKKIALPVAIIMLSSGGAFAALNCTTQPSCTDLGYSKTIDANCESSVSCPFDTSYKACIKYGTAEKPATCADGYAKVVADCGTSGARGWTLGTLDSSGCGKCTAKKCLNAVDSCPEHAMCSLCYTGDTVVSQFGNCMDGYVEAVSLSGEHSCMEKPTVDLEPDNWPTVLKVRISGTYPNGISATYRLEDEAGRLSSMLGTELTQVEGKDVRSISVHMSVWSRSENLTQSCERFWKLGGFFNANKQWTSDYYVGNVQICAFETMDVCFEIEGNNGSTSKCVSLNPDSQTGTITATMKNASNETVTKTLKVKTSTLYKNCPEACLSGGTTIRQDVL